MGTSCGYFRATEFMFFFLFSLHLGRALSTLYFALLTFLLQVNLVSMKRILLLLLLSFFFLLKKPEVEKTLEKLHKRSQEGDENRRVYALSFLLSSFPPHNQK